MPEQKDKLLKFASLSKYSITQRITIRLADVVFFLSIKFLGSLARFEIRGKENLERVRTAGKVPIYALWHNRIFLSTYFFRNRGIVIMTSQSFDGEYIARTLQRFGCGAIRGSSSRGGAKALVEMIKAMRTGMPMAFTVDGPRGPRYEAKLGPIILAKKTGNPIVPFVIEPQKFWTVNSWDKMQIPKPFTRAITIIGEPISVDSNANDAEVESKLLELQKSLDSLVESGKDWRHQSS
ncbi:MAG: lysophospholipid acyltransferase family protein [Chloracidobacterium sp.]|nr:lysophospholipid acyltransferase family protein [Chloracidobacterium sp.]